MKGLLHSKIFRKNLKKWLCMYVGALLLLTTVITYSKYISAFNPNPENARITKFNFVVDSVQNSQIDCKNEEDSVTGEVKVKCSTINAYRPTTEIPYEFTVTPELEVNTFLATTIYIDSKFTPVRLIDKTLSEDTTLYDVKNERFYSKTEENLEDKIVTTISTNVKDENNNDIITKRTTTILKADNSVIEDKITITKNLKIVGNSVEDLNRIQKYHIDVKYNYDEKEFFELVDKSQLDDLPVLTIGYSAIQEK